MVSPLSYEPSPGGSLVDVTNRNAQALHFADTAWQISTNRGWSSWISSCSANAMSWRLSCTARKAGGPGLG
ncbi:MAG: hypothetical protein M5U12_33450 [Verrucomicrobia bacterium]|nr:hypothetical protein [Verrucomicrobiota bacterium]